jgi:dihydrodipicolinate synthase/N-acetylneuraminate lyase
LRLLEKHKNLIGIKDTHPVSRHSQKYINEILPLYPSFAVYTGYDTNCVPVVISGGAGCIGALSNVYPKLCHDLVVALNEGNFNKIVEIQQKIDTYALFYEAYTPFNPLMKWALREMGYSIKENCRVPISKLTDSVKSDLDMVAKRLWRK